MSVERNKALVRRLLEKAWNEGDLAVVEESLSDDFVIHAPAASGRPPGPEVYKQQVTRLRAIYPDLHTTIDDMVAEGDKVVVRGTDRFTDRRKSSDAAPAGEPVSLSWICIYRVAGSRIAEEWGNFDVG